MNPIGFLLGGVVALLVRAAVLGVTRRYGAASRDGIGSRDGVAWAAAVALGYAAGQAGLMASEGAAIGLVWPREAGHWLPLAGLLAAGLALVAGCCRSGRVAALVGGGLLAIGLPVRMLWGSVYLVSEWPAGEAAAKIAGIGAALLGLGWLLTRGGATPNGSSTRPDSSDAEPTGTGAAEGAETACGSRPAGETLSVWLIAPLLFLVVAGLAVVLATSGSLSYARLAGVLAAAVAGAMLGGVGRRRVIELGSGVSAAGPVVVALAGGLLLLGVMYAEVTLREAALLTAALATAGTRRGWAPRCRWRASVLRAVACLVPLVLATVLAAADFAAATAQEEENPYLNWSPPAAADGS